MEEQPQEIIREFDPARLFDSFAGVGRDLIIRPRIFFRQLPRKGKLTNPFLYLSICTFLASLLLANKLKGDYQLFFSLLLANILSAFTGSLVLHGLASKLFGSKVFFDATFRIIAYASITDIGSWIPVVGPLFYFYGLYLIFLGLQEVHELKPKQAGVAVISIVFIVTLLLVGTMLMTPESINQGIKFMDPQSAGE